MNEYIVCTSHRSREKLFRIIAPQKGFYAVTPDYKITGEDIYSVPVEKIPEILEITGIRKFNAKNKEVCDRISFN